MDPKHQAKKSMKFHRGSAMFPAFFEVDSFKASGFSGDSYRSATSWKLKNSMARSHWASLGALQFSLGSTFPFNRWIADLTSSSQGSAATKTRRPPSDFKPTSGLQPIFRWDTASKSVLAKKGATIVPSLGTTTAQRYLKEKKVCRQHSPPGLGSGKRHLDLRRIPHLWRKLSWGRSDPCVCIFFAQPFWCWIFCRRLV